MEDGDPDIVALTETWLRTDITNEELLPNSNKYNIYRHDRSGKRGGGVLIAIKTCISSFLVETNSTAEIVWVACATASTSVLVGTCYWPPDADHSFLDVLRESITCATQQCSTAVVYLLGDFNFPLIDWPNLSSSCHSSAEFISLTLDYNLTQIVDQHTRGPNILDLVLTTAPDTAGPIAYIDGLSDHKLLQLDINIPQTFYRVQTKGIRDYNRADYKNINAELAIFLSEEFLPFFNSRSVNDSWELFKQKLTALVENYVPKIVIANDRSNPWFTKHLRTLRNKKKRLYRAPRRDNQASSWAAYSDFQKSYCKELCAAKDKYFSRDLPSLLINNPRKFWQVI